MSDDFPKVTIKTEKRYVPVGGLPESPICEDALKFLQDLSEKRLVLRLDAMLLHENPVLMILLDEKIRECGLNGTCGIQREE